MAFGSSILYSFVATVYLLHCNCVGHHGLLDMLYLPKYKMIPPSPLSIVMKIPTQKIFNFIAIIRWPPFLRWCSKKILFLYFGKYSIFYTHQVLVLHPSYILEKVGINKKGINQKRYSHQKSGISITEHNQPKDVKSKMRNRKLKSGVNLKGVLKRKGIK